MNALNVMISDKFISEREKIKAFDIWGEENGFIICDEASDQNEVIPKLEKTPTDILIKGIDINYDNGPDLLKIVKEKNLCSCIILLSDNDDYCYVRNSFINGVFDYLIKPVSKDKLKESLERAKRYIFEKEQKEILYNYEDIKQISSMLIDGEEKVYDIILSLVSRICISLNYDLPKLKGLLTRMIILIINESKKKCIWLDKFINGDEWLDIDFSKFKNFSESKEIVQIVVAKAIASFEELALVQYKDDLVRQVCNCVLINIDNGVSLEFVAEKLFMNKNYISRSFKEKTGIAFSTYLKRIKLERAERLMADGKYKIYEISNMMGFSDAEYFSKIFKKHKGSTPKKVMKHYFLLLIICYYVEKVFFFVGQG